MNINARMAMGVVASAALIAACAAGGGDGGGSAASVAETPTVAAGGTITDREAVEAGATCPAGGVRIYYGIDENGNGVLDADERDGSEVICNGTSGASGSDANGLPVATVGADRTVQTGALVTLDGSGSSDPDGDALAYSWVCLAQPEASGAALDDAASARPTFKADASGDYLFVLHVSDTSGVTDVSRVQTVQVADWLVSTDRGDAFDTVEAAVEAASEGDRVAVLAGTYIAPTVTINKAIEVFGEDPETAVIKGMVRVAASGATVRNLGVTNPTAGKGILVLGADDVRILGNRVVNVGTDASHADNTHGICVADNDVAEAFDGAITISGNTITNVGHAANVGHSAAAIFVGDSGAAPELSGRLTISGNRISNVVAKNDEVFANGGRGANGVLINWGVNSTGEVNAARITGNEISGLSGFWVHAIGLETETPNAYVARNRISSLAATKAYVEGVEQVVQDPAAADDCVGGVL